MIKELAEFGKRVRDGHDALKLEPINIDLIINEDGSFDSLLPIESVPKPAEAINAKKGKARLLLDKPEEVLNLISNRELENAAGNYEVAKKRVASKHKLFIDKLKMYEKVSILKPVFLFYDANKVNGIEKAHYNFNQFVPENLRTGNIAFRVGNNRLHEQTVVYAAIVELFEKKQAESKNNKRCSICGNTDFPVVDEPHGYIKNVPDGMSGKNVLVSFDKIAFESYGLKGNDNSSICTNCAKNYVEGLNWLLSHGYIKGVSKHTNRHNFGKDTAMVYWTREEADLTSLNLLDEPDVGMVTNLLNSVASGDYRTLGSITANQFYSITLSGAAARIAIRDWIQISLEEYYNNIASWFNHVKIKRYDKDYKELKVYYPSLYRLAQSCYKKESNDDSVLSRTAKHLWNAALKGNKPPLSILTMVLKRIAHNETTSEGKSINTMTSERAALIRLILNLNNKGDTAMLKDELDLTDTTQSVLCGRLFALIEGIQRAALGNEINAGVRERSFSSASTSPSSAFGRLLRQMQNHLTKLKQEKPGLAFVLDKEVQELCSKIDDFPVIFTLEEQGQFALGYYHQKHYNFNRAKQNKEFQSLNDNMEE